MKMIPLAPCSRALIALLVNEACAVSAVPAKTLFGSFSWRLAVEHDDDLSCRIDEGVIVIFVFGGGDPVSGEQQRAFEIRRARR